MTSTNTLNTPTPPRICDQLRAALDAHAEHALAEYVDMAWRWIRHLDGDASQAPPYSAQMVLRGLQRARLA